MSTAEPSRVPAALPAAWSEPVAARFGRDGRAVELCRQFLLAAEGGGQPWAEGWFALARGHDGASWRLRCLAALVLQAHALRLVGDGERPARAAFLVELGLLDPGAQRVADSVLREGFTSTEPEAFFAQLGRRLARLERLLAAPGGWTPERVAAFLDLVATPCKLALARYLFTPAEVVARILSAVRTSRGVSFLSAEEHAIVLQETRATWAELPAYEREILHLLCRDGRIFWVAEHTSSALNALVEYPQGTVVLVVKPPGSELELELKRAGRRGAHALGVVYRRDGEPVPHPHRFDGGSTTPPLLHEAEMSAVLVQVYRRVHGAPAPMSRTMAISTIYEVPTPQGGVHMLDYFTDPRAFGDGFATMRREMATAIDSFEKECGWVMERMPGELGPTMQFLNQFPPSQAIHAGSSSFRLLQVARYLAADGARTYFRAGLGVAFSERDARGFADHLLEEILGVLTATEAPYRDHYHYLEAVFAVPENRARADRAYRSLMAQIGVFWGTLRAVRGYSWGESFVARNVGLKSVWRDGGWRVTMVFMDHDNLHIDNVVPLGRRLKHFRPFWTCDATCRDEGYILGSPKGPNEIELLAEVYRVDAAVAAEGVAALHAGLAAAYERTLTAMESDPEVGALFDPRFVARNRDWDRVAGWYLAMKDRDDGAGRFAARVTSFLGAKGYDPDLIDDFIGAAKAFASFLERYAYLYDRADSDG